MSGDVLQALLMAALRAIMKSYPQLAFAAIMAELQNLSEEAQKAFEAWWKEAKDSTHAWPGPRLEYDESGTPTGWYFDAGGNRIHMDQG